MRKTVTVAKFGSKLVTVTVKGGTVGDVLRVSGIHPDDYEIRVNGQRATLDQTIEDGDVVILMPPIIND